MKFFEKKNATKLIRKKKDKEIMIIQQKREGKRKRKVQREMEGRKTGIEIVIKNYR